jgi:hypothetical protein
MILTIAEDFTSSVVLDQELRSTPESGLYLNRGVLPILNIENLLAVLPNLDNAFSAWDETVEYGKFQDTKNRADVVLYDGVLYQSLITENEDNQPDISSAYWMETNIESLRIKSWLWSVQENLLSQLSLHRNLIENQYIYDVGESLITLPDDYAGWVFEPKGSDYVKIKINQIALQANTDEDVDLYVINQGVLVTTLTLHPNNGILEFENVGYTISGKGKFYFVIAAQEVYSDSAFNDPLKYNGFVCYPVAGKGSTAATATYTETTVGNGMNFNVSAYMDSSQYVTNNLIHFGRALQAQAEMDFINMVRFNSNVRSNQNERIIGMDKNLLTFHASDLSSNTVARKYQEEIKLAKLAVNATFDRFLKSPKRLVIIRDSI